MRKKKFTILVGVVNFFFILCKMYPLYLSNFQQFCDYEPQNFLFCTIVYGFITFMDIH